MPIATKEFLAELDALAERRRAEIRAAKDTLTFTGLSTMSPPTATTGPTVLPPKPPGERLRACRPPICSPGMRYAFAVVTSSVARSNADRG